MESELKNLIEINAMVEFQRDVEASDKLVKRLVTYFFKNIEEIKQEWEEDQYDPEEQESMRWRNNFMNPDNIGAYDDQL